MAVADLEEQLETYRRELTGYCYRMLASPFDAEDAVQETLLRAWRGIDGFEGRAALRSWLYRIATNVCLDMAEARGRRAMPMDLGDAQAPVAENLDIPGEVTWLEPIPTSAVSDPGDVAVANESIRLAFVAALQHLPPRQRAVLILFEVLRWSAAEIAELLDTGVAAVNSALQRARATLQQRAPSSDEATPVIDDARRALLQRYVAAFEAYDVDALTALLRDDARQSMPPYDMWLSGRDDVLAWWFGPGIGCRGSRMIAVEDANGQVAFGQFKPSTTGTGWDPWALQVLTLGEDGIAEIVFFLDTERLFPLFGLPSHLDA